MYKITVVLKLNRPTQSYVDRTYTHEAVDHRIEGKFLCIDRDFDDSTYYRVKGVERFYTEKS
jgi:hypothetical protein